MAYIGIATKNQKMGRIGLTTFSPKSNDVFSSRMWRKLIEYLSRSANSDVIKIGIIDKDIDDFWFDFSPIDIETIKFNELFIESVRKFDLLIINDNSKNVEVEVSKRLKELVESGVGLLITNPSKSGIISELLEIASVVVQNINPPQTKLYWTKIGSISSIYQPEFTKNAQSLINSASLDDWDIIMSSDKTLYSSTTPSENITYGNGQGESIFIVNTNISMSNGVVVIEEGIESTSSSSESSDNSSSSQTVSSSSSSQITEWDITESIAAHWKLNDADNSNLVRDQISFSNLANLFSSNKRVSTSSKSYSGGIERQLRFDGTSNYAKTAANESLRFNSGASISDFSVNVWITQESLHSGTIISKKDNWELWVNSDGSVKFTLIDDALVTKTYSSSVQSVFINNRTNIHVNVSNTSVSIYVNLISQSLSLIDNGHTGANTTISEIYIGDNGYGNLFHGYIDNIMVIGKQLNIIEIESFYNEGVGTESHKGTFYLVSSSSSSSNSSSSS